MAEHEFYADPTVFDLWQDRTGGWFCSCAVKLRPFVWSMAFSGFAVTLLGIAVGLLGYSFWSQIGGASPLAWNQLAAQWLTVFMALLACHGLLGQALRAWPRDRRLPPRLQTLARLCAGRLAVEAAQSAVAATASSEQGGHRPTARETRTFFARVRAAGVNVTVAKALFAAGIRSAQQLQEMDDAQLLQIHGVGPASVHRLRVHFS